MRIFITMLIYTFLSCSSLYAEEEVALTKEEHISFINKLEKSFEEDIKTDKSLTTDEIKEIRDYIKLLKESETWPKSLKEAVDHIISTMPEDDAELIMNTPKDELINYHHGWGTGIRNAFGLWKGNEELIESACGEPCHPDDASMKIIEAVWKELHHKAAK